MTLGLRGINNLPSIAKLKCLVNSIHIWVRIQFLGLRNLIY
uniref:Uncharacterized protein n=1 Tax=Arundo donax TaxID=35708 RepID=A0A0A9EXF1_ARUDO